MLSAKLTLLSDATQLFLEEIGIDADPIAEKEAFRKACEQANPRYKGGRDLVRFQLEEDSTQWKPQQLRATMILARELGMFNEKRLEGNYDAIIALGGARRSPLHRACYAAEAIARGKAATKVLVIAGSNRPVNEAEQKTVRDFAPEADEEIKICEGAAEVIKKRYPDIRVVTICNPDPKSGNRGVIQRVMAELDGLFHDKIRKVATVTTGIYRTALMFDMMMESPEHGWTYFDAAGHPSDPEMVFNRTTSTYCAENLTTLGKASDVAAIGL
ncbi:MAG: hypothetical protein WCG99_00055 [Candidatus Berkelbacteria bacterium]